MRHREDNQVTTQTETSHPQQVFQAARQLQRALANLDTNRWVRKDICQVSQITMELLDIINNQQLVSTVQLGCHHRPANMIIMATRYHSLEPHHTWSSSRCDQICTDQWEPTSNTRISKGTVWDLNTVWISHGCSHLTWTLRRWLTRWEVFTTHSNRQHSHPKSLKPKPQNLNRIRRLILKTRATQSIKRHRQLRLKQRMHKALISGRRSKWSMELVRLKIRTRIVLTRWQTQKLMAVSKRKQKP